MASNEENVLYVVWSPFEDVAHVVGAATVAVARATDDAPVLIDFGDLRRSGDLDELTWRLEQHDYGSLEDYVSAIEQHAGVVPANDDIAARLAAVNGVDFDGRISDETDGDSASELPADSELFRSESEQEEEPDPEYRGYTIIAQAMSNDIPADLFKKYAAARYGDSPVYSGHIDDSVPRERLPELIAELRARGYTVVED